MKIYISGGITNVPDYVKNFKKAENYLKLRGYEPVNPCELLQESTLLNFADYMIADIIFLQKCDGIYMLDGFLNSDGAKIELAIAKRLKLKIMYENKQWLFRKLKGE